MIAIKAQATARVSPGADLTARGLGAWTSELERFIQRENVRHFRERLDAAPEGPEHERLAHMLAAAERELARLNAHTSGVLSPWQATAPEVLEPARREMLAWFRQEFRDDPRLAALIDPAPGLVIAAVNPTYEASSGRTREQVEGRRLFEAFPDNPGDPAADGVRNLYASLRRVAETGADDTMALQRYDVEGSNGTFAERWWRPLNTPLRDPQDRLVFILHLVEDATAEVLAPRQA